MVSTGTAEVPLGGIYMDKIIEEKQLPKKLAAFGHCFRTEAGAGGTAGKGLYRVHQFSKVEMFVFCTPEQGEALLEELIDIEVCWFIVQCCVSVQTAWVQLVLMHIEHKSRF
jgi:seryl-tRNA synthetase